MSRRGRGRRGQALTEVVVVMPILLVLVMGTIDVARLLYATVALEEAVQEGARYGAYAPNPVSTVRGRVTSSADVPEVTGATVSVSCTTSPAPGTVTVAAVVDYPLITPIVSHLLGGTVEIDASVIAPNLAGSC